MPMNSIVGIGAFAYQFISTLNLELCTEIIHAEN
jgi:hypothetical protein